MHFHQWKRRQFITLLGGAAAWPLAARAQQPPRQPLVRLLSPLSISRRVGTYSGGLSPRDAGTLEGTVRGTNITTARLRQQRATLPTLANELVSLKPAVIAVGLAAAVLETHKATRTIPS